MLLWFKGYPKPLQPGCDLKDRIVVGREHPTATAVSAVENSMGEKVPGVRPGLAEHLVEFLLLLDPMRINSPVNSATGLIGVLGGSLRLRGLALLLLLGLILADEPLATARVPFAEEELRG